MTLVVDALAVARLARLVTTDRAGRPIRRELIGFSYGWLPPRAARLAGIDPPTEAWPSFDRYKGVEPPPVADMVGCRWCVGFWCAVLAVAGRRWCPRVWDPLARALAMSWVAGVSGEAEQVAQAYIDR